MTTRADGVRVARPLFQEEGSGSRPTSALDLWFGTVSMGIAIDLNRIWHSRLPKLDASNLQRTVHRRFYGAEFCGAYYAVAVWTNPVARLLPQDTWLELRRFAIAPDAPRNTASRMLAWMVRDIRASLPGITRVISYQDMACHTGTIYLASGWKATAINECGEWDRPNRFRIKAQSAAPKRRWELEI